jgi:aminoglycoside phosphotransferase (APT) family kinase protein
MPTVPDGIEVVATPDEARQMESPPFLVVESVREFLDKEGIGDGPIAWQRIGDGHSNITFRIQRGADVVVLRRGPRPPHPKSTHDMVREARIQQLVRAAGAPAPEIFAICDDASVIGVPFYVMEFLTGTVITDRVPPGLDTLPGRRAISATTADSLAALHRIDVSTGELSRFGRPDGYLKRQVDRFSSLWGQNTTRDLPDVALVGDWLRRNLPVSQAASVVHGDYRIGNLMFAARPPAKVAALLDWEMATIGDPLADLGYLMATYAVPGSTPTPMELTPVTREPGFMTREEIVRRYRDTMGFDLDALPWYETLALWKAAIFCEAMYTRWLRGERPDDTTFAPTLADGIPAMLRVATSIAGIGR